MRIIFIRHGEPGSGGLTELGHLQAKAAAKRLSSDGEGARISRIFTSPLHRAVQTAAHLYEEFGITPIECEFMREIGWSATDGELFCNGQPWQLSKHMVQNSASLTNENWAIDEPFCRNSATEKVLAIADPFDEWLSNFGYDREGEFYRVSQDNDETVVMVSHAGSSSAALAHLFNLPFPFLCAAMVPMHASITVVSLVGEKGSLISPSFEIFGDSRHTNAPLEHSFLQ